MMEYIVSPLLTPEHKDVTGEPGYYRVRLERVFPSKELLRRMDENRRYRQSLRHNTIEPQEIHDPVLSINKVEVLTSDYYWSNISLQGVIKYVKTKVRQARASMAGDEEKSRHPHHAKRRSTQV